MTREIRPGYELPLLLLGGFRTIIDALHRELAEQGHPDVRPVHGFALQAIGRGSGTVTGLAAALGVSKQAAAKTVRGLERMGYIQRAVDPADRRSQRLVLTQGGTEVLELSAVALAAVRAAWMDQLGPSAVENIENTLQLIVGTPEIAGTVNLPGWLNG